MIMAPGYHNTRGIPQYYVLYCIVYTVLYYIVLILFVYTVLILWRLLPFTVTPLWQMHITCTPQRKARHHSRGQPHPLSSDDRGHCRGAGPADAARCCASIISGIVLCKLLWLSGSLCLTLKYTFRRFSSVRYAARVALVCIHTVGVPEAVLRIIRTSIIPGGITVLCIIRIKY